MKSTAKDLLKLFLIFGTALLILTSISVPLCYKTYGKWITWEETEANVTNTTVFSKPCTYQCCVSKGRCYTCEGTCWIGAVEIRDKWVNVTRNMYGPYEANLILSKLWNGTRSIYVNPKDQNEWEFSEGFYTSGCQVPLIFEGPLVLFLCVGAFCIFWNSSKRRRPIAQEEDKATELEPLN